MKWSLWRAALYGLIIGLAAFAINVMADNGRELAARWSDDRTAEVVGYLGGRLLAAPLIFVVVAFIRNCFVKADPNMRS